MRTLAMRSIADIYCLLSRVASRFEGTRRRGDNKYRNVIPSSTRVQRLSNTGSDSLNSIVAVNVTLSRVANGRRRRLARDAPAAHAARRVVDDDVKRTKQLQGADT